MMVMEMARALVKVCAGAVAVLSLSIVNPLHVFAQSSFVGAGVASSGASSSSGFAPVGSSALRAPVSSSGTYTAGSASSSNSTLARKGGFNTRITVPINLPIIGQTRVTVGHNNSGFFGSVYNNPYAGGIGPGMYAGDGGEFAASACTVLALPLGSFGALVMIVAGLIAVVACAMGGYKSALAFLVVGLGSWSIYPLVTMFYGPICG